MFRSNRLQCVYFLWLFSFSAFADDVLIRELTRMRRTLPYGDPQHRELTLRLADALFDSSLKLDSDVNLDSAGKQRVNTQRKEAATLYEAIRKDEKNLVLKTKIDFQLARLYSSLDQWNRAKPLWVTLSEQDQYLNFKREALLRLAENSEASNAPGALAASKAYYLKALDLCAAEDTCSYIHYRYAWLLRKRQEIEPAISEMENALWDSTGQVREESLRDLIVFLSLQNTDGIASLKRIETLSERLSRPSLMLDLGEAYFSSGNTKAATEVLEYEHSKRPKLYHLVRLLELQYGQRHWDVFETHLEEAERFQGANDDPAHSEKILARLLVQLDGERKTYSQAKGYFQRGVLLYLGLFPASERAAKMREGWLAAETEPRNRLDRIVLWLGNGVPLSEAEKERYKKMRLGLAQELKDHAQVVLAIEELLPGLKGKELNEHQYLKALALCQLERKQEALALLSSLADPSLLEESQALNAQKLVLESLVAEKRYSEVIAQASRWTQNEALRRRPTLKSEIEKMDTLVDQANFEVAAAMERDPKALKFFFEYCSQGKFIPKSCENAEVLAVHLKDRDRLLALLKLQNKDKQLAEESEASGYFAEAGKLWESLLLKSNPEEKHFLKVALLYELGQQTADRDRILKMFVSGLERRTEMGQSEPAIYKTLSDAKLIGPNLIKLPWSPEFKLRMANDLELSGQGSEVTKKLLLSSKKYVGEAWSKYVMDLIAEKNSQQQKIEFYGSGGEKKFEQRLKKLKDLVELSEGYAEGADPKTQREIFQLLADSHRELSKKIRESPIPKEVEGDLLIQIQANLDTMAVPFDDKAARYVALLAAHETATPEKSLSPEKVAAKHDPYFLQSALIKLHANPEDSKALSSLHDYYEQRGNLRLAGYFKGRLSQVEERVETP